jgi:hypothetical protein
MKRFSFVVGILAMAMGPVCAVGQGADQGSTKAASEPEHYYRLNFTLEEMNDAGKVANSRSYFATIVTGRGATQQIRTGSRIPIATGTHDGSTQFQYVDVGVSVDVRQVKEVGDKLGFSLTAEVSSLAPQANAMTGTVGNDPVIRQNKWDSAVLIPIGKPTVVFSSDDLDDKGKLQVELTATRVE